MSCELWLVSNLGLNYQVLRTFYIACIRSIIDYSTLILVNSKNDVSSLEKIQNQALRIMFGAPPWAKLVNMRMEASMVPVTVRVKKMAVGVMCRALRRGRLEVLNAEVLQSLQQQQGGLGPAAAAAAAASLFALRMAQCLQDMGITLVVART